MIDDYLGEPARFNPEWKDIKIEDLVNYWKSEVKINMNKVDFDFFVSGLKIVMRTEGFAKAELEMIEFMYKGAYTMNQIKNVINVLRENG